MANDFKSIFDETPKLLSKGEWWVAFKAALLHLVTDVKVQNSGENAAGIRRPANSPVITRLSKNV
jgi:hypothetical protein